LVDAVPKAFGISLRSFASSSYKLEPAKKYYIYRVKEKKGEVLMKITPYKELKKTA